MFLYFIESSSKVFTVNPESDNILNTASSLCRDEREIEAESLVKNQLVIDPDNLQLRTKLGEIQARLCKENEAEVTFRDVLNCDPTYEDAVCFLGRLLNQSFRIEESEQIYREFLRGNPTGHHALDDLCRLLLSENRNNEALALARSQVEKYSDQFDAYTVLANTLKIIEDELESDLDEDNKNEIFFLNYMGNLLEQLELVFKLETHIAIGDELHCEVEDEKSRLVGGITHLLGSIGARKITLSSDFEHRIRSALQFANNEE
jgi:tetratricopeptide (TPR) repeat protein